jgi:Fe-S cluster assembly ATPase SufC
VHEKILRGAFLDISSEYLFYVVGIGGKGKKNLLMYLLFI